MAETNLRTSLGLEAASNGDPKGAGVFLNFVYRELIMMGIDGSLPTPVADRIRAVAREVERVGDFVEGFNSRTEET